MISLINSENLKELRKILGDSRACRSKLKLNPGIIDLKPEFRSIFMGKIILRSISINNISTIYRGIFNMIDHVIRKLL